eukprot:scaffold4409_cov369-Prasinococcus_capsulatus_cf.AAC.38
MTWLQSNAANGGLAHDATRRQRQAGTEWSEECNIPSLPLECGLLYAVRGSCTGLDASLRFSSSASCSRRPRSPPSTRCGRGDPGSASRSTSVGCVTFFFFFFFFAAATTRTTRQLVCACRLAKVWHGGRHSLCTKGASDPPNPIGAAPRIRASAAPQVSSARTYSACVVVAGANLVMSRRPPLLLCGTGLRACDKLAGPRVASGGAMPRCGVSDARRRRCCCCCC